MDVRVIYLSVVSSLLISCSGNKSEKEESELYKDQCAFSFYDSLNTLVIQNPYDQEAFFSFNINNTFPLSIASCVKEIMHSELSYPQSAWKFVIENTFHSYPFTTDNWQHNPELFLNSLGGGFCDDRASVLAYIYRAMGDSARIIGLNGHVVTEIFYNNKWQMFDPDNEVFYCDKNGAVLSVDELEDNNEQIKSPLNFCNEKLTNPVFSSRNSLTDRFAGYYASTVDNSDVSKWHTPLYTTDTTYVLPSNSSLVITLLRNGSIASIAVELTERSKGRVKIPLVPARAVGQFDLIIEEKRVSVGDTGFIFTEHQFINEIRIEKVLSVSNVYYFVNPKLKLNTDTNSIELFSSSKLNLTQKSSNVITAIFAEEFLFFDTINKTYPHFYKNLPSLSNNDDINNYLTEEYIRFLKSEGTLNESEISEALNQLRIDITLLSKDEPHLRMLIQKNYPKSVFYLFAASKHNRIDYLKKIINDEQ